MKLSALKSLESFKRIQVFQTQGYECCAIRFHKDTGTVIMPPSKGPLILRKTMDLWMVSRANGTVSKHPGLWPCILEEEKKYGLHFLLS